MKINLSFALVASILICSAQSADRNLAVDILTLSKNFAGPIAYGASNKVLTRNVANDDIKSTIDATVGMFAHAIKNQFEDLAAERKAQAEAEAKRKEEEVSGKNFGPWPETPVKSSARRTAEVLQEVIKPLLVLGTVKVGLPILNEAFKRAQLPQMAIVDNVSIKTAQKLVLFYVGLAKTLGMLSEKYIK